MAVMCAPTPRFNSRTIVYPAKLLSTTTALEVNTSDGATSIVNKRYAEDPKWASRYPGMKIIFNRAKE